MSENLHNIDKLFKEGIEGQEEMPSENVWNGLDARLDKKKFASMTGKYNKLKWVAAALFIFSLGMGMYAYHVHRNAAIARRGKPGLPTASYNHQQGGVVRNTPVPAAKRAFPALPDQPLASADKKQTAESGHMPVQEPAPDKSLPQLAADAGRLQHSKPPVMHSDTSPGAPENRRDFSGNNAPVPAGRAGKASRRLESKKEKTAAGNDRSLFAQAPPQHALPEPPATSPGLQAALVNVIPAPEQELTTDYQVTAASYKKLLIDSAFLASSASYVKLTPVSHTGFTVTAFFTPNLVGNQIENDHPHFREDDKNEIKDKEQGGFSWSAGALFAYNRNRWSLESGLVFSNKSTVIGQKTIYARPDEHGNIKYRFNCSSGYSFIDLKQGNPLNGDTAQALSSTSRLRYLSVPLVLKYGFGSGKLQFTTGAGLQANFLTSRKIETFITKGTSNEYANTSDIQGLRSVYVSGILSAGVSYRFNKIFVVSLTPTAQLGFSSINRNAPVKSYINFYGLASGISIKL